MGSTLGVLAAWTLLGAAWVLVHFFLLARALRSENPLGHARWVALVPPAAPFVAWKGGYRVIAIAWMALCVVYVVARLVGGAMLSSPA